MKFTTKFIDGSLLRLPARNGQDVIMMGMLSAVSLMQQNLLSLSIVAVPKTD